MRDDTLTTGGQGAAAATRGQELRLVWAGMLLIAVCYGLGRYAYGFFVPVFRVEFGLDAAVVGAIAAGSYVSYAVAIMLSTILVPRFGARPVAVAAGCLATGGLLLVAFAPNTVVLAIGVLIAGSSTGVSSPPLVDVVARTVRAASRDRVQTVINAAAGAGVAIAGPVALVTQEHWQAAWVAFAIACAAVTVYVAFTVRSAPNRGFGRCSRPLLLPQPLFPVGSGRLMTAAGLMGCASAAVWTFGRDVFVNVGEMGEAASTTAWVVLGAAGVLGAAAGNLGRRFGISRVWLVAMLMMAVVTILLAAFPFLDLIAWAAASAFGTVYMTLTGLLLVWGTQVYALTPAARVGLAFLIMSLGQAVAAPLIGALYEGIDPRTAFTVAAIVALVGAFVRPPSRECTAHSILKYLGDGRAAPSAVGATDRRERISSRSGSQGRGCTSTASSEKASTNHCSGSIFRLR